MECQGRESASTGGGGLPSGAPALKDPRMSMLMHKAPGSSCLWYWSSRVMASRMEEQEGRRRPAELIEDGSDWQ